MKYVVNLYKPPGVTPLQVIESLRDTFPEYTDVKLGYAGRLDPMAEGVLLILVGEENKKRRYYELLQKTYTFDILFGVTTDTYDALGMITGSNPNVSFKKISANLPGVIAEIKRSTEQVYPPYSSRAVNGRPLYYWARQNKLDEISIPVHPITIYELGIENIQSVASKKLREYIFRTVSDVTGDFRQKKILARWETYLSEGKEHVIASCILRCSSGTYVRSICNDIGVKLSVGGIALRIKRERVGNYIAEKALKLAQ